MPTSQPNIARPADNGSGSALNSQQGGKPLAIDLCCGLGGWTEGLLSEGYYVVGFDIESHEYGGERYPGHLVLQDVLTLHGSQFKDAALIVASPPCQEYSYMAMPWSRAKAKAAAIRADTTGAELERLIREVLLFIEEYHSLNDGVSPSQTEIAEALGHRGRGNITHRSLNALEYGGFIRRLHNRNRAIEVLKPQRTRIPVYDAKTNQLREYLP